MRAAVAAWLSMCSACGASEEGTQQNGSTPDAANVDAPPTGATVTGSVRRTAQPSSSGDARGSIYIAIFDRDPVIERDAAQVVARTVLADADLTATTTSLPYTLPNVPPRASKYYVVGFLDDNGNVDLSSSSDAGPDKGDLVSLDGLASPKLSLATADAVTFDVTLNTVLPF